MTNLQQTTAHEVIKTDKEGMTKLRERTRELKDDPVFPPGTRTMLERILEAAAYTVEDHDGRSRSVSLEALWADNIVVRYTFDKTRIRDKLRSRGVTVTRTSVPPGDVSFDGVFERAWKHLQETLS